jgi:hypothetical protein
MDTTETTETVTRPYTELDSRDGTILSIVLGVVLGCCACTFSMLTSISLDNVMMIAGVSTVGSSMFAFGMYGDRMRIREFNQLFGFVTTVVVTISVYGLLQLF